jgi:hypothetical protein
MREICNDVGRSGEMSWVLAVLKHMLLGSAMQRDQREDFLFDGE